MSQQIGTKVLLFCVLGAIGCGQRKKLHACVVVPAAPVRVPSQRPLAPNVASVTSVANSKGDNEMILGAVHRSPEICLTAEENPRKAQLGDSLMKGLCDQSSPQMGLLQMRSVRSHSTSGREKEGNKERKRWLLSLG